MAKQQFFGRLTWVAALVLVAAHVVAIPVQHHLVPSVVVLALVFVATVWVAARSLHDGLLLALGEIIVGGHGHLVAAELPGFTVSLRMVIFVAVMTVWAVRCLRREAVPRFQAFRDTPFLFLFVAIVVGTVRGFMMNDPAKAFDDMNGYLTLGYLLPLLGVTWDNDARRRLLQTMVVGALWVASTTIALLYVFTHLPGKQLHAVYTFVRDARLAEITLIDAGQQWYFRIFEQSQIFVLFALLIFSAAAFGMWKAQRLPRFAVASLALLAAAFLAGQSRSFVLGLAAGGVAVLCYAAWEVRDRPWFGVATTARLAGAVLLGAILAATIVVVPLPPRPDLSNAAFYQEKTDDARTLAVSSRWNLLYPMFSAIMENPVLGSGFGKEVTYVSDDPRVRDINPSGEWTTYRFEWGYQDIWLKIGLLGLIAVIWYVIVVTQAFIYTSRTQGHRWLLAGLYAGLLALMTAHVFSPYLNHPLGLAYILFILPFFDWDGTAKAMAKDEVAAPQPVTLAAPKPVVTNVTKSPQG